MYNPNIKNKGFRSFYKELLQNRDYYSIDVNKTYLQNLSDLRQKAYMENTCAFIYKMAEDIYGLPYAEKLVAEIVNGDISITQIERYPFKEFKTLETNIYSLDYVNTCDFYKPNNKDINYIIYFSEIEHLIMDHLRYGQAVNVMDFSLSLGLYFQRAVNLRTFGSAVINEAKDRVYIFNQLLLRLIHTFSVSPYECDQPVTFSILDRVAYSRMTRNRRFSKAVDEEARELKNHAGFDYSQYLKSIKAFLKAFDMLGKFHNNYRTPRVRVYLACSDTLTIEFIKAVARLCGCLPSNVEDTFQGMRINENLDTTSPEFNEAIDHCMLLAGKRLKRSRLPKEMIIQILKDLLASKISDENKFVAVDKELESMLFSEKNYISNLEVIYYKPNRGVNFLPTASETSIDYKFLSKDSQGLEDFKARLSDAYLDAQTINLFRRKLVPVKKDKKERKDRLNVKIKNIDEDMYYTVYDIVNKVNKQLINTYGDCFTFEIVKPIYVNEKFSKFYQL